MKPVYPEPLRVHPELAEGPSLPEADRPLSSRLRQETQETHHEVSGVAQDSFL